MTAAAQVFAVPVLVLVVCAGWGWLFTRGLQRFLRERDHLSMTSGQVVVLGLCLYLVAVGLVLSLDRADARFVSAWSALGLLLAAVGGVLWLRAKKTSGRVAPSLGLLGALAAVTGGQVAFARYVPGLNGCDDEVAYLYLARRLLSTGDLLDAFNQRRLISFGGMTAIQAWNLRFLSDNFLHAADLVVGAALILVLLATGRRRGIVVGLVLTTPLLISPAVAGSMANSSLRLIPAALVLATYQHLAELFDAPTRRLATARAVVVGLHLAALLTIRPNFVVGPAVVAVVALVAWWRTGGSLVPLASCVGTGVAACAGWSGALWRSSGTPLFPLLSGNYDPSFPGARDPGGFRLTTLVEKTWQLLSDASFGVALVAVLVAFTLLSPGDRRRATQRTFAWAAVAGVSATTVSAATFLGSNVGDIQRFTAPVLLGTVLFGLWALVQPEPTPPEQAGVLAPVNRSRVGALLGIVLVLVMAGVSLEDVRAGVARRGTLVQAMLSDEELSSDPYASVRGSYGTASRLVPPGSDVLAAVDLPGLLDARRFHLATLDVPGSVSPGGHLPFFAGDRAKLRYLRDQSLDYLIAVDPAHSSCLYNDAKWRENLRSADIYARWTPYALEWNTFVRHLVASDLPVERVGNLYVIAIGGARDGQR